MLGNAINNDFTIIRNFGKEDTRRRTRNTRRDLKTVRPFVLGTKDIATIKKSKIFQESIKNLCRRANIFNIISQVKMPRHILSIKDNKGPATSTTDLIVSKPSVIAFIIITIKIKRCTFSLKTNLQQFIFQPFLISF